MYFLLCSNSKFYTYSEDKIQVSTEEISLLSSHATTKQHDVSPSSTTTQTVEAGENGERLWRQPVY